VRVLVALVAASCASAPEPPPVSKQPAKPRTLYMLATENGVTACRGWELHPSTNAQPALLVDHDERIGFVRDGDEIVLHSRSRRDRRAGELTTPCYARFRIFDTGDGFDLEGARWWDHQIECTLAQINRERIATDLSTCAWKPPSTLQQQAAAQRKLESILRTGGRAFTIADDTCVRVHAVPDRALDRTLTGVLFAELHAGPKRGRTTYSYELVPGALTIRLFGPTVEWSDGGGSMTTCHTDRPLVYGTNSVELWQTLYLTPQACRAALDQERRRRAWLPERAEYNLTTHVLGGGCR
jgi:hypothetical protein